MTTRLATYRGPYGPNTRIVYKGPCDCCSGNANCRSEINVTYSGISLANCGCQAKANCTGTPVIQNGSFQWTSLGSSKVNRSFTIPFRSEGVFAGKPYCLYELLPDAVPALGTVAVLTEYSDTDGTCVNNPTVRNFELFNIYVAVHKLTHVILQTAFILQEGGNPVCKYIPVGGRISDISLYVHYSDNLNGYDPAVTVGGVIPNVLNDCSAVLAAPLPFHRNWQSLDPGNGGQAIFGY